MRGNGHGRRRANWGSRWSGFGPSWGGAWPVYYGPGDPMPTQTLLETTPGDVATAVANGAPVPGTTKAPTDAEVKSVRNKKLLIAGGIAAAAYYLFMK